MYTATFEIDGMVAPTTVSLTAEMSARVLMEAAFIQLQTDINMDPFKPVLQYYGYDHFGGVKSYLGYLVVSINGQPSDNSKYWDMLVNGVESSVGIDSYAVQPGDAIVLKLKDAATPSSSAAAVANANRVS